jgi:Ca2+-transporting ATPase
LLSNRYLIGSIVVGLVLQSAVIGVPAMRNAFHLRMLDPRGWVTVLVFGAVPLLLNEANKALLRARKKRSWFQHPLH